MVVRLFTKPNIRRKLMYVFICVFLSHDFLLSIALYFSALSLCPCLCRRLSHFHLSLTLSLSLHTHILFQSFLFFFFSFSLSLSLSLSISLFLPLHTLVFQAAYDQLELTKPSIPRSKPIPLFFVFPNPNLSKLFYLDFLFVHVSVGVSPTLLLTFFLCSCLSPCFPQYSSINSGFRI